MSDSTRQVDVVQWEQPSLRNESWQTLSLGCAQCPERPLCGGLRLGAHAYDCTSFCCADPKKCLKVCKNNRNYVARKREINGFELDNVLRTPRLPYLSLPGVVPLIQNGSGRDQPLDVRVVALPFFQIVLASKAKVRFRSKAELCQYFRIQPSSFIVASGVATDGPLEAWWKLEDRRGLIRELKTAGVDLVTTPNYSLFSAVPRWDNLHAMKRIGIVWSEFQLEGLPAAVHLNAASEHDYERWAGFIAERLEASLVAVEFGTGAGHPGRRQQHVEWLCKLASSIDRPLTLVVRGAKELLGRLSGSFSRVVYLDSDAFLKTQNRHRADITRSGKLIWRSIPTLPGIALDELLAHNVDAVERDINRRIAQASSLRRAGGHRRRGQADRRDEKAPVVGTLRETQLPEGW